MSEKKQQFLMQGSILAMAGLIVRLIGLVYRIPMIAIIGDEGNGYYTSAYGIYSLFLILSSYSFPTAISQLISYRLANKRYKDMFTVISCAFRLALVVGTVMFFIMFFGADFIAALMRKPNTSFALRALAPTLFIMAFLGVLRGIFQGMGNMVPTAISQIFEQVANAVASIFFAYTLFNKGAVANLIYDSNDYTYAYGAQGGAIGTGVGAFVALIVLTFMYLRMRNRFKKFSTNNNYFELETNKEVFNALYLTIIPIVISCTVYNIEAVLDDFIYSNVATMLGDGENIVVQLGVFGKYHLLFNIPVAIANSLTSSIIPTLSYSVALRDAKSVVLKTRYSIKYTLLIVLPAFVGLYILADPICRVLFMSSEINTLITMVKIGSLATVFFSLATVTNGILQGLGRLYLSIKNSLIALVMHVVMLLTMLIVFRQGIYSVVYSNIAFSLLVFTLNIIDIRRFVRFKMRWLEIYILPFIISVIMGVVVYYLNNVLIGILGDEGQFLLIIRLIICVGVGVSVYAFLISLFRVVKRRDAEYIPFINKLGGLLRE